MLSLQWRWAGEGNDPRWRMLRGRQGIAAAFQVASFRGSRPWSCGRNLGESVFQFWNLKCQSADERIGTKTEWDWECSRPRHVKSDDPKVAYYDPMSQQ